ncbi:hypothetical protein I8D64_04805 [Brachybacterium sp. MASK1Z-5]|uniref:Uncharacterized protein n=1 Tax=Brachybacterium halotolerans TaxID=2795215 RepID=A0ABS1B7W0_9MICO|nr:hypothetical protein [Brachybacterium halotolerans]MBK0330716.1 hypothetical protein [Brachybacterium halotolerans]
MITPAVEGVLPKFKTFESNISLDAIREMKVSSDGKRSYAQANLDHAEAKGADDVAEVLRGLISEYDAKVRKRGLAAAAKTNSDGAVTAPNNGVTCAAESASTKRVVPAKGKAVATSADALVGVAPSSLEKRMRTLEKRLAVTEARTVTNASKLGRLQKMWPVRSWERFAAWRHGK